MRPCFHLGGGGGGFLVNSFLNLPYLKALDRLLEVQNKGVEPDDGEDVQPDCDGVHVEHQGWWGKREVQVPGVVELTNSAAWAHFS